jgi:hypothetical protein
MTSKLFVLLFIAGSLLSGCGSVTTVFHPQPIAIPASQFQCENPTDRPSGDKIMESSVAKYIASLEKTIPDCKLRLKELSVIMECFNDKKCDPKSLMRGLAVASLKTGG